MEKARKNCPQIQRAARGWKSGTFGRGGAAFPAFGDGVVHEETESISTVAGMSPNEMLEHARSIAEAPLPSQTGKPASVTGRAIVGGIIGGTPGAIIGAASAIDKNSRR